MVYLLETELNDDKYIVVALQSIYGIGKSTSLFICKKLGFSKNLTVKELSNTQLIKLGQTVESLDLLINNDLRKKQSLIFKQFIDIKLRKGLRALLGFPIRGQRTHSNAKTSSKLNLKRR